MNCPMCRNSMSYGAPHCETIKTQAECGNCGHIEPEYYTPEELALNRLVEQCSGASYKDCRQALEDAGYDETRARRILDEKYLDAVCRESSGTAEDFARAKMEKPLSQVTNVGLQFLTLEAVKGRDH